MAMTFGGNPTPSDVTRSTQPNTFTQNQTLEGTNNTAPNQTAASGGSIMTKDLVSVYLGPYSNAYSGGGINPSLYNNSIFAPIINDRFGTVSAPGFSDRCLCFDLFYLPKQTTISKAFFRVTATSCVSKNIQSLTQTSGTATVSSTNHGFLNGDYIIIEGADQSDYNKYVRITVIDSNNFTYSVASSAISTATGSISASEGMSMAFYNADFQTAVPTTIIPNSEAVINCVSTGIKEITFNPTWTTPSNGFFWVGIAASRKTGNGALITIPAAAHTTNLGIRGILFGSGTSTDMQQFRGGVSLLQNQIFAEYNNISQLPNPATPQFSSDSSAAGGSGWANTVQYIGIR